jgi:hypothetical protein
MVLEQIGRKCGNLRVMVPSDVGLKAKVTVGSVQHMIRGLHMAHRQILTISFHTAFPCLVGHITELNTLKHEEKKREREREEKVEE